MMKRFISLMLCLACFVLLFPIQNTSAAEYSVERIELEDGAYIEITTTVADMGTRAVLTRAGTKNITYYSSNDVALWKAVLQGVFQYTGSSSECVDAVCTVTIYDNSWHLASKTATHSGETAYATVKMNLKKLGVVVETKTVNLSLSCDANGNIY